MLPQGRSPRMILLLAFGELRFCAPALPPTILAAQHLADLVSIVCARSPALRSAAVTLKNRS
jgi:hypothetical protein